MSRAETKLREHVSDLRQEVYYRSDPSVLARSFWYYVNCLGKAPVPGGYRHRHRDETYFLLHYIRRGEMWHTIENQTYGVPAGSACLMYLQKPVSYGTKPNQTAEDWWVEFGGRDMPNMFLELEADENPVFVLPDARRFERLFDELFVLIRDQPVAYQVKSCGVLSLILGELFAARGYRDETKIDRFIPPEKRALLSASVLGGIRIVMRYYESPTLNLKEICNEATPLSLHYFSRLFHRETGMSPVRYLTRYRIEKAKELLRMTPHAIREIARMVGIPNPRVFARSFHKIVGRSPSQFRSKNTPTAARKGTRG